jgi:hypothetical protein
MAPGKGWFANLFSKDRRGDERLVASRLVAYYWDGAVPVPHQIRDINQNGAYLLTEQRWYPGTIVSMTLQTRDKIDSESGQAIAVQARVVRSGPDGVGLRFLHPEPGKPRPAHVTDGEVADRRAIQRFLRALSSESGEISAATALLWLPDGILSLISRQNSLPGRLPFGLTDAISSGCGIPSVSVAKQDEVEPRREA